MSDRLEEILEQLQTAHNYSDNKEPYLTNQRKDAKQALQSYIDSKIIEELTKLLDAEIIKPEYHNLIVGKIMELKSNG